MNSGARTMIQQGWLLTPEGAVVHPTERVAVIADVHLGYEWSRASRGDMVPAHSLFETLRKLAALRERAEFHRLIVAGDLVESSRPCRRTAEDVLRLRRKLGDWGVELLRLRGNHDPSGGPAEAEVAGWTIGHGDLPLPFPSIFGHHHPALRFEEVAAGCFLVGPSFIALPAFSPNAAGLDVCGRAWPRHLADPEARCVASAGDVLLDFGPRGRLVRRRSVAGAPGPR